MTDSPPAKTPGPKKSDLGVRFISAIVMITIAGGALWAGGWIFTAFVGLIAIGLLWEWWGLVSKFVNKPLHRFLWLLGGAFYVGFAVFELLELRGGISALIYPPPPDELVELWAFPNLYAIWPVLVVLLTVIAVDVGAYFSGRLIGGPKIAPKISPSKTWSGLVGGIVSATLVLCGLHWIFIRHIEFCDFPGICDFSGLDFLVFSILAIAAGVSAQSGDFFESWMKRRAGVKDSSNLIPGHGGLLDRMDGLLAVLFLVGVIRFGATLIGDAG